MPGGRDLRDYRQKRNLDATPEPPGEDLERGGLPAAAARAFVVQQHAARALHWDLRLEIGGVLVSWAIPKGPSLDRGERRLAVQTEDHPLEYADFEGVIPEGNYGAGAMIVWDRGSYHTADGADPLEALEQGKLDLFLSGYKLRGRFALVRTRRNERGRDWLLICKRPAAGLDAAGAIGPASVLSGLTVEELRDGATRVSQLLAWVRAHASGPQIPRGQLAPMLARSAERPFTRPGWLFEVKYDGMRVLAQRSGETVRLRSRSGRDVSDLFPEVAHALRALPLASFVIDGELVVFDDAGRSSFERLQRRLAALGRRALARAQVELSTQFCVFDLLEIDGRDVRHLPLRQRKEILQQVVPALGVVQFVDAIEQEGEALFALASQNGIEGIVAKRTDSPYVCGARSDDWIKVKVRRSARLVVVGLQEGRGSRAALGSLLLGWWQGDTLRYAGRVGSGLDARTIDTWLPRLVADAQPGPAAEGIPPESLARTTHVRPRHVVRVRYSDRTRAGHLRHPVFEAFEADGDPGACRAPVDADQLLAEVPAHPPAHERELRISNRDKVFFPDEGYTKGDLLDYYEAVWPWLAPYLKDRPLVLTRYPDGISGKSFFQKNAPDWTPSWVGRIQVDETDHFLCNDLESLLYVINSGAIPLHVSSARASSLERPDWMVLDLDPKGAPFTQVVEIARSIHRLLDGLACPSHVKTSGQEGLHVLVPLAGQLDHAQARGFAEALARVVCAELPDLATIVRPVAARGARVYVDYLQNGRGKLIAAPLSVRPRPGACVSTPLRWSQVTVRLTPERLHIRSVPRRLAREGDPMAPLLLERAPVVEMLDVLLERLAH